MARISLKDQYDNKDAIQQIKIATDICNESCEISEEAKSIAETAEANSKEAIATANEARSLAEDAQAQVAALEAEHDAYVAEQAARDAAQDAAIEAVEAEAEQALTDANDAFDEVAMSQDASTATLKLTRGTDAEVDTPLPIASASQAGILNAEMYTAYEGYAQRISALESGGEYPVYVEFDTDTPDQSVITALYSEASGAEPAKGATVEDIARGLRFVYDGSKWVQTLGTPTSPFSTGYLGLIMGADGATPGQIVAESTGIGSVAGWDAHVADLATLQSKVAADEATLDTVKDDLATAEADIALLETSKQKTLISTVVTIPVAGWTDGTYSASIADVKVDSIIWIAPASDSMSIYSAAGITCSAQAEGVLTFTASGTPSAAVDVNVIIG